MYFSETKEDVDIETVCNLLDKLTLQQLYLMEEKMQNELHIENNIKDGCLEFAKSRYIMGQSAVSATCLPTESSVEFSASQVCQKDEENGIPKLKLLDNDAENTVNPMKWFGVLVPSHMHRAQSYFKRTTEFVIDCVNVQLQLIDVINKIALLKLYKKIKLVWVVKNKLKFYQ